MELVFTSISVKSRVDVCLYLSWTSFNGIFYGLIGSLLEFSFFDNFITGVCKCVFWVYKYEWTPPMEWSLWRRWIKKEEIAQLLHVEVVSLCIAFLV